MNTAAKIGIGLGVAALVGTGIYFAFIKKADAVTGSAGGAGSAPAGASSAPKQTELDKKIGIAKKAALTAKCNLKTPAPRFKQSKQDEFKKCMLGADGYTWGNS